jgi:hypothetical protein
MDKSITLPVIRSIAHGSKPWAMGQIKPSSKTIQWFLEQDFCLWG